MRKISTYLVTIFGISISSTVIANTVIIQRYGPPNRVVVHKVYPQPCAREKIIRYEHGREVIVYKNKCRFPHANKTVIYR